MQTLLYIALVGNGAMQRQADGLDVHYPCHMHLQVASAERYLVILSGANQRR